MKDNTILLRQVHPAFIQGERISDQVFSSQVFKPTQKDNGLLSTYNGDEFDAISAYEHFVSMEIGTSIGVVGVSHQECKNVSLNVIADNIPFKGHCSIDYTGLSQNEVSKKSKVLKVFASQRGWLYRKN
ncbi:MAG TPA: hypothetical protein PLY70_15285 [Saprospiraceae bacterium]|nr:hypothetical protein [Saprospiraceae bacterium]HPN68144.1 hypothetical protein [Saprospiraceae bacterium]